MPLQSTSTSSVGSPFSSTSGGAATQGDPPPMSPEPRRSADGATAGETYHRLSQAVQRAAAVRKATLSSRGPVRTLSMEEEQFIRLHHGCQG